MRNLECKFYVVKFHSKALKELLTTYIRAARRLRVADINAICVRPSADWALDFSVHEQIERWSTTTQRAFRPQLSVVNLAMYCPSYAIYVLQGYFQHFIIY